MKRVGVIMAGGAGERFWPLSRRARPKQFLNIPDGGPSLLAQCAMRLRAALGEEGVYVVTGSSLVEPTLAEVPWLSRDRILVEPLRKNTAGAIVWAMAHLPADAVTGFFPADHVIRDVAAFEADLKRAYGVAEGQGALVVFGIRPLRPDGAFGYVEAPGQGGAVKAFHEKPSPELAAQYLAGDRHFWNAGMFVWRSDAFMAELRVADPLTAKIAEHLAGRPDDSAGAFEEMPSVSVDKLVLEKSQNVWLVPATFDWDDVGSLDALRRFMDCDASGNAFSGVIAMKGSEQSTVINRSSLEVAIVGVRDLIVIVTDDAVLVCASDRSQDVRSAVDEIASRNPGRV